jgi:hypothetical protein
MNDKRISLALPYLGDKLDSCDVTALFAHRSAYGRKREAATRSFTTFKTKALL